MAHSHSHTHAHGEEEEPVAPPATRRVLAALVLVVTGLAVVGLIAFWPRGHRPTLGAELGFSTARVHATVRSIDVAPCQGTTAADGILCEQVTIKITSGATKGKESYFELAISPSSPNLDAGDKLVVGYNPEAPTGLQYNFEDFQRSTPLLLLGLIFVGAVIALGRLQGVRALAALVVTGVVVFAFVLPALLHGSSPLGVALVGAAVIALAALYLTHGINERTTVALLGTFGALAITGVLALVFVAAARFSGLASEDALLLQVASVQIDVRGLLLAGIVIGTLGVLDDVTVTQVSAVWELHQANPDYGAAHLYTAATRIGRDHIASTVNTLVLAYAGASLPLLLLYSQAGRKITDVVTGEVVAVEVVRTLVGSIGLVAAVPITTLLAAVVVSQDKGGARRTPARRREPELADVPSDEPDRPSASWDDFAPDV